VLDDYKRRHRETAARNPVSFTIGVALAMGILGVAIFDNVLAGIAGCVSTAAFSWFWWRPGGPGARRVKAD
jgi:hypothetical protein